MMDYYYPEASKQASKQASKKKLLSFHQFFVF
jgi:hypothetical protein